MPLLALCAIVNSVVRSYRNRSTQVVAERRYVRGFPETILAQARKKLVMLNNATDLNDLRVPPGDRLEALSGERQGQYSIRINDQWRICFERRDGHSFQVEIVDYH